MQRQHLLRYYVTTAYVRQDLLCSNGNTAPARYYVTTAYVKTRFALF